MIHNHTARQSPNVVVQVFRKWERMRRHQDNPPPALESRDNSAEDRYGLTVKGAVGFIEEEHICITNNAQSDAQSLPQSG